MSELLPQLLPKGYALPQANVMIGITHTADGQKIIKESKVLKISIGYPKGRACEVYVDGDGNWVVRSIKKGAGKEFKTVATVPTRAEAEQAFYKAWREAETLHFPRKAPFFQFTRKAINKEDDTEMYVPDFDAIAAASFANKAKPGMPTEIDIVFLDEQPFSGGYKFWSASELKCSGDGINALRVLSMATTPEEKELARQAAAIGKKVFPIVNGCWTCNCPYSKETFVNGKAQASPCKPSAEIRFQLASNVRVGCTAAYQTGGFRSIVQLFSAIERIRSIFGHVTKIPLTMTIGTHKTNHNNQPAKQYNVSLEFRAGNIDALRSKMLEQTTSIQKSLGVQPSLSTALLPDDITDVDEMDELTDGDGEGYDPDLEDAHDEPGATIMPPAAIATQTKQDKIGELLRQQREAAAPAQVAPWKDYDDMKAKMAEQHKRVGGVVFNIVLMKHNVRHGTMSLGAPAEAAYKDLLLEQGEDGDAF